ncbi:hypothetical protein SGL43_02152 [Streptomyces globisporus]|uniref:Uncharacterized protein n=1 Tax=Streptomyces globisporus TaxID=1908 RepID=A0ABM9GVG8_STRGL|nr:hypothetical protein SGL43_02152 [Streptomyces globisporus]
MRPVARQRRLFGRSAPRTAYGMAHRISVGLARESTPLAA